MPTARMGALSILRVHDFESGKRSRVESLDAPTGFNIEEHDVGGVEVHDTGDEPELGIDN